MFSPAQIEHGTCSTSANLFLDVREACGPEFLVDRGSWLGLGFLQAREDYQGGRYPCGVGFKNHQP